MFRSVWKLWQTWQAFSQIRPINNPLKVNFAFFTVVFQIPKSNVEFKPLPWIKENDSFILTAYFKQPRTSKEYLSPSPSKNIGDQLLILNSSTSTEKLIQIPTKESELVRSAWTEGQCFYTMGRNCFKLKQFPVNIRPYSLLFVFLLFYVVQGFHEMGLTPADLCFHSSFLPNSLLLYIILNKSCFLFHLRIQSFCLHACIKNSPLDPIRHVLMSHFFRIIPVCMRLFVKYFALLLFSQESFIGMTCQTYQTAIPCFLFF